VFRRRPAGATQARDYGATICLGGRAEARLSWLRPFEKDSKKLESALSRQNCAPVPIPRTLRIAASDYACVVLFPPLVKRLAKSAPNLDLQVVSSNHLDAVRQLDVGQADLVIGSFSKLPGSACRKTLLRESEVIVVRAQHPPTRGKVTKENLG
jgi:DNA-binding transcriptional LysR family regulator